MQSLAKPLAEAGITIFYLSTYETDFVLVNSLLLLQLCCVVVRECCSYIRRKVPEEKVGAAINCLKAKFKVALEGASPSQQIRIDKRAPPLMQLPVHLPPSTPRKRPIGTTPVKLYLCQAFDAYRHALNSIILEELFFSNRFPLPLDHFLELKFLMQSGINSFLSPRQTMRYPSFSMKLCEGKYIP